MGKEEKMSVNSERLWRMESHINGGSKWFVLKWHWHERLETSRKMSHIAAPQSQGLSCPSTAADAVIQTAPNLVFRHALAFQPLSYHYQWSCLLLHAHAHAENKLSKIATGQCQYVKKKGLIILCVLQTPCMFQFTASPKPTAPALTFSLTNHFTFSGRYKQCNQIPNWGLIRRKFTRQFWYGLCQ